MNTYTAIQFYSKIVVHSRNRRHVNATMRSLCIVVELHVAVNNIKTLRVAMVTQEWVPFGLLSSDIIYRCEHYKYTTDFMLSAQNSCQTLTKFGVSPQIFVKIPNIKCHTNLSNNSRAATCGHTD